MQALDPLSFFLWDSPRFLADIRSKEAFLKGSMKHAISVPITYYKSYLDFLDNRLFSQTKPVHIIDSDGKTAKQLSERFPLVFLKGGYNNFKIWRNDSFNAGPKVNVLAGYTGSGKTEFLEFLYKNGHQVIDLEYLAVHRGSVFGKIENKVQPLHEHFQNNLLEIWLSLNSNKPVWIEEKGPFLGKAGIPELLQKKMQNSTLYHLKVPFEKRLQYLMEVYGDFDSNEFKKAIRKLEPRMGTSNSHKALHFYESGQIKKCFELLLNYYDKGYDQRRSRVWKGKIINVNHNRDDLDGTLQQIEKL